MTIEYAIALLVLALLAGWLCGTTARTLSDLFN